MKLTARAHSKVNIHLSVGDAREDGYHELETIFQSLSLFDELTMASSTSTAKHEISVTGLGADAVPTDSRNLVWKALDLMETNQAWSIHLTKGIPTAGGMAGGSADAAATLRICNEFLRSGANQKSEDELQEIAAQLGSDVPFTLLGGTALGTGRGEKLVPLETHGNYHWALAFNDRGLSTPAVFAKLDAMRMQNPALPRAGSVDQVREALAIGSTSGVAKLLANDLQAPALELLPELVDTLARGESAGALRGIVSGSGPTCAFLCENAQAADEVAAALVRDRLASSSATATGPAAGAVLVESAAE